MLNNHPRWGLGMDVTILLGSSSDLPIAQKCTKILEHFDVPYQLRDQIRNAAKEIAAILQSNDTQSKKDERIKGKLDKTLNKSALENILIDEVVKYTLALENSTTIARVGFFLESQSGKLMPKNSHIKILQKGKPKGKRYLIRRGGPQCVNVKNWNLLVV